MKIDTANQYSRSWSFLDSEHQDCNHGSLFRNALVGTVALMLAGCLSFGEPIPVEHVGTLQVGVQDRAQVQQLFGPPQSQITSLRHHPQGCTERWNYFYAPSLDDASSYRAQSLIVDFNVFGRVCAVTYGDSRQLPAPSASHEKTGG